MNAPSRLDSKFFERPTLGVARDLLGKVLVRQIGKRRLAALITETEAYIGERDLACHARFGKTKRNAVMYGPGGVWYVYLIYGMYWLLNIITERENRPAGVLIRSAILTDSGRVLGGPGKLTKTLRIDGAFYGRSVTSDGLFVEDRGIRPHRIERTPRIGISYAGPYKHKKWRFVFHPQ
jgi:DNA-3-methyladenine glycosylase